MVATEERTPPARDGKDGWTVLRHLAMCSGMIPAEDMARLSREQLKAFLQVEDPAQWPPGLEHLAGYADLHKKMV